jgi:hypothetical protein
VLQLGKVHRLLLAELARLAPLPPGRQTLAFIDIDSQKKRVCGHKKQGAAFGHTKIQGKSLLVRGLNALAATISTPLGAPVIAATRLLGGNALSPRCCVLRHWSSPRLSRHVSCRKGNPLVLFYVTDDDRAGEEVERLIRTAGFEPVKAGRDRTVGSTRGGRRPSRSRGRPRRGAVIDRCGLIASPPWPGAPLRPGLRPDGLDGADHQVSKGTDSGIEDEVAPATTCKHPGR